MKFQKPDMSFSWKNYLKPTPQNLMFFVDGAKLIVASVAITSYVEDNAKLGFWLLISGGVLDLLSKFFAKVAKDSMEVVRVEYPAEMADQVNVTTETKEEEK